MTYKTYKPGTVIAARGALVILISIHLCSLSFAKPLCDPWAAKAISVEGNVELRRAGIAVWKKMMLHDILCAGDRVRVDPRSRAAILLQNQTLLRLDEGTAITFSKIEQDKPSWLDLLKGAVHFISRTQKYFRINTPFVNAAIEGTEFAIRIEPAETAIWVFEGQVSASNPLGGLTLASGESAIAQKSRAPEKRIVIKPREAVQWTLYYPPVIDYRIDAYLPGPEREAIKFALERYRRDDLPGAFASLAKVPENQRTAGYYNLSAGLLLTVGRVDEARADIDKALKFDPKDATAHALQSVIAATQNEDEKALKLAQKAVDLDPQSPTAQVALSYAYQALFEIEKARDSIEKAIILDSENALAWARLSELELSLGYLDKALATAQKATDLDPDVARTQTVLGFANLTLIDIDEAKKAFKKAVELDPSAPLPRLGRGLAMIRQGDLDEGTKEIEIAAILDPDNSLIRSYLGKAYYEQKRISLARTEFAIAKELDPKDPTPYFYDAILKQTTNRPVKALHDLQKSIELNNNRAVYRSRLLLDDDLAARSAALGRIYNDLGFQQRGLLEGWKSVNEDPSNHSAHRLLADNYAALPRHEIARVSELLRSQLLQPTNITPVQPQLAESNLLILNGLGPAETSFNEFNPLFARNGFALQASGVAGNNSILGDELVHSGLWGKFSYSLGQFHLETDGIRKNNDLKQDIYNAFFQWDAASGTSFQAEFRYSKLNRGALVVRDPELISPTFRKKNRVQEARIGFRHEISGSSQLIGSVIYQRADENDKLFKDLSINSENDGFVGEAQYLFRSNIGNLVAGFGHLTADQKLTDVTSFGSNSTNNKVRNTNLYTYTQLKFPLDFTWNFGVSADFYDGIVDDEEVNPKFGLIWNPVPRTTLRAAVFKMLRTKFNPLEKSIEPTQVAGFNQLFDDPEGAKVWRYGIGIDQQLMAILSTGAEFSKRDLTVPSLVLDPFGIEAPTARKDDEDEKAVRAYLNWTPHSSIALGVDYFIERIKTEFPVLTETGITTNQTSVRTQRLPLNLRFFHPSGFNSGLRISYVNQKGKFQNLFGEFIPRDDSFWIVDASIGYRLPKRWGFVTLEGKNLGNKSFLFQEIDLRRPLVSRDRQILFRFTTSFF